MTKIRLTTNKGAIDIELNTEKAPVTCANFEKYVKSGFYDGTLFHRVIKGFMIQGGGIVRAGFFKSLKRKETDAPIENEAANGLTNDKYTIAMARTGEPHSATSQFFINVKDNAFLNYKEATPQGYGYAVFGKVVDGFDVVDAIEAVATGTSGSYSDVPKDDVIIEKAEVLGAS